MNIVEATTAPDRVHKDIEYSWWQHGIVYQIYPRSFQDSNGDGIGDLNGIRQRLDYLQDLGVQTIWLSPIFPSPMADFGYDIMDYCNVDSCFGSLRDLDDLINDVHGRGMKILLDLVPNHTSSQHPWFMESRSSRDNPKRDWYIWQNRRPDGGTPNNWRSCFGGSAWEWDEHTAQYYYHAFHKEQPDLNWRNPEVRKAMYDVMRFWLDRGVDGFRIDVLWHLIKDLQLKDNPANPDYLPHMSTYDELLPVYSTDQPEVHLVVSEMRELLDEYDSRIMIGEIYLPINRLVAYYGTERKGAHLPFNFQLITLPWDSALIGVMIQQYEAALPAGGWPNWVLGNHDQPRIGSRVGAEQAKVAAVLLMTLRGTPTMYYGDEIGMRDVPIPRSEARDPQAVNMPEKHVGRDPARTPMQWSDDVNGGFSSTTPWLRVDRNFRTVNVETMRRDPSSVLSLYKKLIRLRSSEPSLMYGDYSPVYNDNQLLSFLRNTPGYAAFLVILNMSHRTAVFRNDDESFSGTIVISTSSELEGAKFSGEWVLAGDEAYIIRLDDKEDI